MGLKLVIFYGSVQPERQAIKAARFVVNECKDRRHVVARVSGAWMLPSSYGGVFTACRATACRLSHALFGNDYEAGLRGTCAHPSTLTRRSARKRSVTPCANTARSCDE